jgi:SAM-dependent methyltransferase
LGLNPFNEKDTRRLYHDLSWIWPIVSPPEDYVEESEFFCSTIKEKAAIEVRTLFHLGCGGGRNDYTFKKHFKVTGLDLSPEMLEMARDLNPGLHYICGDMRTIRLGTSFDAVTALDSINYMITEDDLLRTFQTAYHHLNPGGIFLTFAEESFERFRQNRTIASTHTQGDTQVTFIENSFDPDLSDNHFEMTFIYLVRKRPRQEIHTDSHLWGIFEKQTWPRLLRKTGFDVEELKFENSTFLEDDFLPMFVCFKPE